MNINFRRTALYSALGTTLAAMASGAQAQLVLEEVMVTAQKRVESLQDVPISVNAMAGAKMDDAGVTNLETMTATSPTSR